MKKELDRQVEREQYRGMDSRDVTNKALDDFHRDVAAAFSQNDMDMQISDLDPDLEADAEIQRRWREMNRDDLKPARGVSSSVVLSILLWLAMAAFWWLFFGELTR